LGDEAVNFTVFLVRHALGLYAGHISADLKRLLKEYVGMHSKYLFDMFPVELHETIMQFLKFDDVISLERAGVHVDGAAYLETDSGRPALTRYERGGLSPEAVQSTMLLLEDLLRSIHGATKLSETSGGRPQLLPALIATAAPIDAAIVRFRQGLSAAVLHADSAEECLAAARAISTALASPIAEVAQLDAAPLHILNHVLSAGKAPLRSWAGSVSWCSRRRSTPAAPRRSRRSPT
jgi:hypothetical protein